MRSEKKIPSAFICPITFEIMEDPVMCVDGHTYERAAIDRWLKENKNSPMTGARLSSIWFTTNFTLKKAIAEWREENDIKPTPKITSPTAVDYPIHLIVKNGNADALPAFTNEEDWKLKGKEGCTAIVLAARLKKWDLVKLMAVAYPPNTPKPASKEQANAYGLHHAFLLATQDNQSDVMTALRKAGASTHHSLTRTNSSAIHFRAMQNSRDYGMFELSDLKLKNNDGDTPIVLAAKFEKWDAVEVMTMSFTERLSTEDATQYGLHEAFSLAAKANATKALLKLGKAGAVSMTFPEKKLSVNDIKKFYINRAGFFNASNRIFTGNQTSEQILALLKTRAANNKNGASEQTVKEIERRMGAM
ncbi:MAG: hypothetical protein ACD_70C00208G0002 [uncultured bacterium]|nr:MAG: hypothetical protein ACD_70C00208G0002 [uncultured bacterium]OGT26646.1 MAG: hypothetical protein A3B71_03230 [Gammaproteobacteria bacterium RIFCSPHIGHO2_02_FULL_42_43]OGT28343.1 MAG: hypothetical protein A2624_04300 [Gammaproteobacteria bacterium RIFCSPHIGHO2_01_FULL_42_8]OGT53047.1 MAG: hypothetical protein A3E54_08295 [Gammaproteobacteria bacterium RIFCSPHIGHO2_12_FULL_41_25]OGT61179.1 MAG: hypothetical protein A3I77_07400 [Gammaproteobacteria bacterium RIFCSPLOWO2_02_FULL_42_14]OGT